MSNVLPFRRPEPVRLARDGDDLAAGDLLDVLERLEDLSARAAAMGRPPREVECTVQNLLDAVGAVERALDCIGEGEQSAPG